MSKRKKPKTNRRRDTTQGADSKRGTTQTAEGTPATAKSMPVEVPAAAGPLAPNEGGETAPEPFITND